jgi:hypothetical protein
MESHWSGIEVAIRYIFASVMAYEGMFKVMNLLVADPVRLRWGISATIMAVTVRAIQLSVLTNGIVPSLRFHRHIVLQQHHPIFRPHIRQHVRYK